MDEDEAASQRRLAACEQMRRDMDKDFIWSARIR